MPTFDLKDTAYEGRIAGRPWSGPRPSLECTRCGSSRTPAGSSAAPSTRTVTPRGSGHGRPRRCSTWMRYAAPTGGHELMVELLPQPHGFEGCRTPGTSGRHCFPRGPSKADRRPLVRAPLCRPRPLMRTTANTRSSPTSTSLSTCQIRPKSPRSRSPMPGPRQPRLVVRSPEMRVPVQTTSRSTSPSHRRCRPDSNAPARDQLDVLLRHRPPSIPLRGNGGSGRMTSNSADRQVAPCKENDEISDPIRPQRPPDEHRPGHGSGHARGAAPLARSRPRSGRQSIAKASAIRTLERLAREGRRQPLPPMPEGW